MGRFCDIKCYPGFKFAVRRPPYYNCGFNGTWSHGPPGYPDNTDFLFPACVGKSFESTIMSKF